MLYKNFNDTCYWFRVGFRVRIFITFILILEMMVHLYSSVENIHKRDTQINAVHHVKWNEVLFFRQSYPHTSWVI